MLRKERRLLLREPSVQSSDDDFDQTRHRERRPTPGVDMIGARQRQLLVRREPSTQSSDDDFENAWGNHNKAMALADATPQHQQQQQFAKDKQISKLRVMVRNVSMHSSDDERENHFDTGKDVLRNKRLERLKTSPSVQSSDDELDAYFGVKADRSQVKRLSVAPELPTLNDGGPDFNWHDYGLECYGLFPPTDPERWISRMSANIEASKNSLENSSVAINLLFANAMQRVAIAINLERMIKYKKGELPYDEPPLRLLIQGSAGVGKTFVIKGITHVTRRLFQDNDSVMNLAPTGTASVLLPQGRTVSSITPIPRNRKVSRHRKLSEIPLEDNSMQKLRKLTGTGLTLKLKCLNLDERSQYSKRDLGWSNQRFNEAVGCHKYTFGGVPIVNFFGDLGQLGPTRDDKADLHLPANNDYEESKVGYEVYRAFNQAVILSQTMRQAADQVTFRDLLLRIRNGTATEEDWMNINNRSEEELSEEEQKNFCHDKVITIMETWIEVNEENHRKLAEKNIPVACVRSVGCGKHHDLEYKQCGQIVYETLLAVGSRVFLTKDQNGLANYGLNAGAMGTVISIMYDEDCAPPEFPRVVVVEFPGYSGPPWVPQQPKWVPIPVDVGNCDANCCFRKGLPLMPGYAIPVFESQGMTIGANQPATHCRIKLSSNKIEKLGATYTALSRVDCYDKWMLVEKIPRERIDYINNNPIMDARKREEMRLDDLAHETMETFRKYAKTEDFVGLLRELDELCNDGWKDGECKVNSSVCKCMLCAQYQLF